MKALFEQIKHIPESEITAFQYYDEVFDAPWHYHPQLELTCILEGKGIRYVGNDISAFEELDLVLLGGNLPHCWKKSQGIGGMAKSYVIQWNESAIPALLDLKRIHLCLQKASQGIQFTAEQAQKVIPMMEAMINGKTNSYIKLLEILDFLSKVEPARIIAGSGYKGDISLESQNRIEVILNYISTHYRRKITLEELAELLHMTEPSFSRFFSQRFQKPFTAYLNEYRINQASRMLIETDLQVAQIGFACGYESLSFFYTQFKKYQNLSPLKFRNKHRKSTFLT